MLKKLMAPDDVGWAERTITAAMTTLTGMGFDVHAFGEGASVWLCGVQIPHSRGLVGPSVADVVLPALTDALPSAVGGGDRKSGVWGQSVRVRGGPGGLRSFKKNNKQHQHPTH